MADRRRCRIMPASRTRPLRGGRRRRHDHPGLAGAIATRCPRALRSELPPRWTPRRRTTPVRVVVLSHTGPVFCSGMDLKEEAVAAPGAAGGPGAAGDPAADLALPEAGGRQGGRPGPGRRHRHAGGRGHRGRGADGDLRVHRGADRADPRGDLGAGAAPGGARRGPGAVAHRRGLRRGAGAGDRPGQRGRPTTSTRAVAGYRAGSAGRAARRALAGTKAMLRPGWTTRTSGTPRCWTSRPPSSPPRRPGRARCRSPRSAPAELGVGVAVAWLSG